ncbi:hypothetical protein TrLO_g8976 [Triparma laevis f. longispina]|uniref:Tyrosine-protein kinase ephrin type A/B receptor-like domain-containing protein n=1 Tax=Triparma laevis f. longispina TaxID=1714387 RepID=A0A9W7FUI7_9STRA|nr:hypothetical protein TrLO_g8976 [Triparma laevis f. longispina]
MVPSMYSMRLALSMIILLLSLASQPSLGDEGIARSVDASEAQGRRRMAATFTIIARDRWGDGWYGRVLSVSDVNTCEVVANSTGPDRGCSYNPSRGHTCERTETVSLGCGNFSASMSYYCTSECSWVIKDSAGLTVAEASGSSSATFSNSLCASCGLGSGAVSETECEACPDGKYSDVDGPGPCKICPTGKFSFSGSGE